MVNSKKSKIEDLVHEIDQCLAMDLVFPALFMSLVLPDLCGKAKWPDLSRSGKTKERYIRWFDEYVNPHLHPLDCVNLNHESDICFGAKECYCLRCSMLHAGEPDITEEMKVKEFYIDFSSAKLSGCLMKSDGCFVSEAGKWRVIPTFFVKAAFLVRSMLAAVSAFQKEQASRDVVI